MAMEGSSCLMETTIKGKSNTEGLVEMEHTLHMTRFTKDPSKIT